MASYFPRFSSSRRQNVVDSQGVAEDVNIRITIQKQLPLTQNQMVLKQN